MFQTSPNLIGKIISNIYLFWWCSTNPPKKGHLPTPDFCGWYKHVETIPKTMCPCMIGFPTSQKVQKTKSMATLHPVRLRLLLPVSKIRKVHSPRVTDRTIGSWINWKTGEWSIPKLNFLNAKSKMFDQYCMLNLKYLAKISVLADMVQGGAP